VKIVWEQSVYIGNAPVFCAICGHRAYPVRTRRNRLMLAVLYDDRDVMQGEACRDCVTSGSAEIKTRLQERIEKLQQQMNELQAMAQSEIETPSLEEEFQFHCQDAS